MTRRADQEDRSTGTIRGTPSDDRLNGDHTNNRIEGGAGQDILKGEGGADILVGGTGADTLTGGPGPDVFLYTAVDEAAGDTITDFNRHEGDRIDVSRLRDSFVFTGDTPFPFPDLCGFEVTMTGLPCWAIPMASRKRKRLF